MDSPTHYELLCVTPEATAAEIRASYRRLVRIYHPDVAGAAGAAMTLRLNEAQRVLLDDDLRSRVDRSSAAPATPPPTRAPTASTAGWNAARATPRTPARQARPVWDALAIGAIVIILIATGAVFAFAYSGPVGTITPRVIPPIIIALVWMVGGLARPPRLAFVLLGSAMLLVPLAAAGIWPLNVLVAASPSHIWVLLVLSCLSAIVLRAAASRMSGYRARPAGSRRASAA